VATKVDAPQVSPTPKTGAFLLARYAFEMRTAEADSAIEGAVRISTEWVTGAANVNRLLRLERWSLNLRPNPESYEIALHG